MRKILLITVLLVFLAGCASEYTIYDSAETVELFKESILLKNQLRQDPSNTALKKELAQKIFELDLGRAEVAGVREGNEPFFIDNNANKSVLLIHGFTASPWEMKELGDVLSEQGYNVYGVLIAGHGTKRSDMRSTSWRDWYDSVKTAYSALDLIGKDTYIVGVSLGGTLGLLLSEEYLVSGVVCLACPLRFRNSKSSLAPVLKYVWWYSRSELTEEEVPYYYAYRPLASIEQLNTLIETSASGLGDIITPILFMQSTEDPTVDPSSVDLLYERVKSSDKEIVMFDTPYHILTKSDVKEVVFDKTLTFVKSKGLNNK